MTTTPTHSLTLEEVCGILQNRQKDWDDDVFRSAEYSFRKAMEERGFEYDRNYPYFRRQLKDNDPVDYLSVENIGEKFPQTFFLGSIPSGDEDINFEIVLRRVINDSLTPRSPLVSDMSLRRPYPYLGTHKSSAFDRSYYWVGKRLLPPLDIISAVTVVGGLVLSDLALLLTGVAGAACSLAIDKWCLYGSVFSERSARKRACQTFKKEYLPRAVHSSKPYDFEIIKKVL